MDKKLILKRSALRKRHVKNKFNSKATFETFMSKNGIINNNNKNDNNKNDNDILNSGNIKEFFTQNGISFAENKDLREKITLDSNNSQENNALNFLTSNGINIEGNSINESESSEQPSETSNENETIYNDLE